MSIFAFVLKIAGAIALFMVDFAWLTGTLNPHLNVTATVVTAVVALVMGFLLGRRHPVK